MENLITYLGCVRVEIKSNESMIYFMVNTFEDIIEKIISFFDKHHVQGVYIIYIIFVIYIYVTLLLKKISFNFRRFRKN